MTMAPLLAAMPKPSEELERAVKRANRAAQGDSNDGHISALSDALHEALDIIGYEGEREFG